jgi:outer membrane immunogenic protein
MKKLLSISGIAAAAALAFAGPASAADMPVKAPPPPPPPVVYDWSGLYVGFHDGYQWGSVHDTSASGGALSDVGGGSFSGDSNANYGIIGFHAGIQWEFTGLFGFSGVVLGAEGGLNSPLSHNDVSNFAPCANPAFSCGLRSMGDNWYGGGKLGLAFTMPYLPWWFSGDYLFSVSGGYSTANFQRASIVNATGAFGGGGESLGWHHGAYVGVGLEHILYKGTFVDWVSGADWQHHFLNDGTDINANGVAHTLSADVDIVRLRTTLKFK